LGASLGDFDLTHGLLLGLLSLLLALLQHLALPLGKGRFPLAECPFATMIMGSSLRLGAGELLLSGFKGGFEPLAFVLQFFVSEFEGR